MSIWLRKQDALSSRDGYVCSDIDYFWRNFKDKHYMFLEEKCRMSKPTRNQWELLIAENVVHKRYGSQQFCGVHIIQFENESPTDGKIYVDGTEVTEEELIQFLQFKGPLCKIKSMAKLRRRIGDK